MRTWQSRVGSWCDCQEQQGQPSHPYRRVLQRSMEVVCAAEQAGRLVGLPRTTRAGFPSMSCSPAGHGGGAVPGGAGWEEAGVNAKDSKGNLPIHFAAWQREHGGGGTAERWEEAGVSQEQKGSLPIHFVHTPTGAWRWCGTWRSRVGGGWCDCQGRQGQPSHPYRRVLQQTWRWCGLCGGEESDVFSSSAGFPSMSLHSPTGMEVVRYWRSWGGRS